MSADVDAVRRLLRESEYLPAYDRILRALEDAPDDTTLLELCVRAEERLDLKDRIEGTLDRLEQVAPDSEELHGFRGKIYKTRARGTRGAAQRAFQRKALEAYVRGYEATGGYWTGINVATLMLLLGDEQAQVVAARVEADVTETLAPAQLSNERLWCLGTLGDAQAVQGRLDEACQTYERVRELVLEMDAFDVLESVRQNANEILAHLDVAADHPVRHPLRKVRFAVCVGHMIDAPDRVKPRFPTDSEEVVAKAISEIIDREDVNGGFSSLASGADMLFQEALADRGLLGQAVIPYRPQPFRQISVDPAGETWGWRFDHLLESIVVKPVMPFVIHADGLEFEFCSRYIDGMARMRAAQAGAELVSIAVWDRVDQGDGPGGTADAVRRWRGGAARVFIVDPISGEAELQPPLPQPPDGSIRSESGEFAIRALFFADAVNFSKLNERQNNEFVRTFLGGIGDILDSERYRDRISVRNTWGDSIFLVVDDVVVAGEVALAIRDHLRHPVTREKLRGAGLPDTLALRMSLHVAVVRKVEDPITRTSRVTGAQIATGARLEPVTPAGFVYASEPFVALCRSTGDESLRFGYVGEMQLAKDFGKLPIYQVDRA